MTNKKDGTRQQPTPEGLQEKGGSLRLANIELSNLQEGLTYQPKE